MEFAAGQLLREPIGTTVRYDIRERRALPGDETPTELVGSVTLMRTDKGILVSTDLHCTVAGRCSRCLTEVTYPVRLAFQEEYWPTADASTGEMLPPPDDPDAFLIDPHQILDLTEALRQYRVMAEPMQPLCKPDCLGLCPRCGYNLNQGPCGCPRQDVDDRWSALTELAEKLGRE
jgi:uncharacterized protein